MDTLPTDNHVSLVGAGLVGSLLSIYLANRGFMVDLYERRPDMRTQGAHGGRSINLAISTRGIHSLAEVGLEDEILKMALPMCGRLIHSVKGEMVFQRYGIQERECIYSLSRGDLNKALMSYAESTGRVKISFEQTATEIDFARHLLHLEGPDGAAHAKPYRVVIGTDGSASHLRNDLMVAAGSKSEEEKLPYGYKELTIPAGKDKGHVFAKNVLHIWPRADFMLIALPNLDGSFTATLFLPFEGPISFAAIKTKEDVHALFVEYFNDAWSQMPKLTDEYFENPTGQMVTIKTSPWSYGNQLLLMGDAAHAIVPFFGQGMNCGFEDCSVFDKILGQKGMNWEATFKEFFIQRKTNADAIADMAAENFVEMRDKVAQPQFLMQKEVEVLLQAKFPKTYSSRYRHVTFSRIPYRLAYDAGIVQNEILEELCRHLKRPEDVDFERAQVLIESKLSPLFTSSNEWT